jgi:hypothetical protein
MESMKLTLYMWQNDIDHSEQSILWKPRRALRSLVELAPKFRRTRHSEASPNSEGENKPLATAMIPYIKGLSESVRRILGKYDIRTAFKTTNTLGRMLTMQGERSIIQNHAVRDQV